MGFGKVGAFGMSRTSTFFGRVIPSAIAADLIKHAGIVRRFCDVTVSLAPEASPDLSV